jgi:hypothetical protein
MKYEQESDHFTISCPFSRILPVSQSDLAAHQAKWAPTSKAEAWVFWICQFPLLSYHCHSECGDSVETKSKGDSYLEPITLFGD